MILGLEPFRYETSVLKCPTGVYALVGTIPQYMDRLCFENESIAELALTEAMEALETGHANKDAQFYTIAENAPRELRPGTIHLKKVIVTADMLG